MVNPATDLKTLTSTVSLPLTDSFSVNVSEPQLNTGIATTLQNFNCVLLMILSQTSGYCFILLPTFISAIRYKMYRPLLSIFV